MKKYSEMTEDELTELKMAFIANGNLNAAREIDEFRHMYGKRVKVVKGRKVPHGTEGVVFFLKRYDNSKYGDSFGIYSNTRIGFKDDAGEAYFTSYDNVVLI